jgi:hypothetical protein
MARRGVTDSIVEYGIQTLNGKTILMLMNDLTEAEHTLVLIGEGRLVRHRSTAPGSRCLLTGRIRD